MALEVGDIVLCTVDRIVGTTVFVSIEGNGEGSIVTSEIAPGRIRNLRDYVVPKKKIVCKVLRISGDRIELSLRRVTQKEQKEIKEQYKQERSYKNILKSVLGDKAEETLNKISKKEKIYDFLQGAKKDSKELEEVVGKTDAKKILEILNAQKQKKAVIKKEISLTTKEGDGLTRIKNLLSDIQDVGVRYIAAGRYSLKTESKDIKTADQNLTKTLEELEKKARKQKIEFSIIKK
jgi:translation initiation factor 2 alpha subunit (eIF-2alpha)